MIRINEEGTAMAEETKAGGAESPAMEFVVAALRENPTTSFRDLKTKAEANGFELFPIVFGRAKAWLGLVPTKPRTTKAERVEEPAVERAQRPAASRIPSRVGGRAPGPELLFVTAQLQANPDMKPRDIKAAGAAQGLAIGPQHIARGRTRLSESILSAPKIERAATQKPATPPPARQVRDQAGALSLGIDSLVGSIRELQAERDRLRGALQRIAEIVARLR